MLWFLLFLFGFWFLVSGFKFLVFAFCFLFFVFFGFAWFHPKADNQSLNVVGILLNIKDCSNDCGSITVNCGRNDITPENPSQSQAYID